MSRDLVWACTIGPVDAGIVGALEDAYRRRTGGQVRHIAAGSGEALRIAGSGGADLVMTHARILEEQFVEAGYGVARHDLMYNDFVIMGPASDPAGIRGSKSAAAAFGLIAAKGCHFVSRGDGSGTHVKEMEIWAAAGVQPHGPWYETFERGSSGNVATLLHAGEKESYTLIERATYVTTRSRTSIVLLVEKDEILLNYISVIPVNHRKVSGVDAEGSRSFVQWLESAEAQRIIRDFGLDEYGEALFFPNAPEGKRP